MFDKQTNILRKEFSHLGKKDFQEVEKVTSNN